MAGHSLSIQGFVSQNPIVLRINDVVYAQNVMGVHRQASDLIDDTVSQIRCYSGAARPRAKEHGKLTVGRRAASFNSVHCVLCSGLPCCDLVALSSNVGAASALDGGNAPQASTAFQVSLFGLWMSPCCEYFFSHVLIFLASKFRSVSTTLS